jgi:ssDNA-binding Zn-finger/Zn-ribbon topoisomerase 1
MMRHHKRQRLYPIPTDALRLDAECPECGTPPAARISREDREIARAQPPDAFKQTQQCPNCRLIYPVPAAAFQNAA